MCWYYGPPLNIDDLDAWVTDEQFWREDVKMLETGRERFIPEEKITDENGATRWVQTVKRPFTLPYSKELHVLGVCTDITERKHMEERLRESEERYRELFENATDIVYTIDLKGNFVLKMCLMWMIMIEFMHIWK